MLLARRVLPLVIAAALLAPRAFAQVSVGVSVRIAPPALPVYDQPPCPAPGYVWTPGYWAWDDEAGYYWVPGTWVAAPVGMLWTPGWWGWSGGFYVWHHGYWGRHVGFYGGINYGHGYTGVGYWGGGWRGRVFYYNTSVTNVGGAHVTAVYSQTVAIPRASMVSHNGGPGGVVARPTVAEAQAMRAPHLAPLAAQDQHQSLAAREPQLAARANRGVPPVAATSQAAQFSGHAVAARAPGAPFQAPTMSPHEARGPAVATRAHGAPMQGAPAAGPHHSARARGTGMRGGHARHAGPHHGGHHRR